MKQILQLLFSIIIFTTGQLSAQDQLEVQRCADIDRSVPIKNIFIDRDNNKWVADGQGLFLAQSPDFAKTIDGKTGQWNLLSAPDGNRELYFPKAQLEEIIGMDVSQITCASINKKKELWIGTADKGLFHLNTKKGLSLLKNLNSGNSKLRSNTIQSIFITKEGALLAATDNGLLSKNGSKESLFSKGYNFTAIANNKGTIWVIADDEVLEMGKKGDLFETEFDERMFDGKPVDIDFDRKGNLWIASEVVVRYHFESETFDFFGPAEDFTSQSVKCIAADSDGALWVGTQNKGVFYIGKSSSLNGVVQVTEYLDCTNGAKNAALEVRASGGEPPYTYQWNQGLVGETPNNLGPGTYAVTITDQKGKKATAEVTIKESKFTVAVRQVKEAALGGGKDGSATVEINGGSGTFTYIWDSGETTATALQLAAGEHSVTISETNGCVTSATVTIKEKLGELSVNLEQTEAIVCAGNKNGALKATVSGGQAPYQYQWMGAAGFTEAATNLGAGNYKVVVTDSNNNTTVGEVVINEPKNLTGTAKVKSPATANNADGKATVKGAGGTGKKYQYKWDTGETGATASKLALGQHIVTITDEKGCTVTTTVEITEDILPLSLSLESSNSIKCVGDNTGGLKAEVSGGKSPFTYQWSSGGSTGESASNLSAGDYSLTITDASGTTAIANTKIKAPDPLEITLKVQASATTNNSDGKASAKVKGGTGKYSYAWDSNETTAKASKLAPGNHQLVVTDGNGCTATANIEITEDILPLSLSLESSNAVKCVGDNTGGLKAEVSGGKSPFTYQWSSGGATGELASNLSVGDYSLTITDASGTTAIANAKIKAPDPLEITLKVQASATTNNSDGKASAKVKGGTGKYSYAWDNNENTAKASKLAPGNHQLVVTDGNGCTTTANIEITEDILPLSLSLESSNAIKCVGDNTGGLKAEVSGGKSPFTYQWSSGGSTGESSSNLSAGDYSLTITDASGTTAIANAKIKAPDPLEVSLNVEASATTNNSDGKASAKVKGGTGKYSYAWDNNENTAKASKLAPGNHQLVVTDGNGCTATANIEITEDILPLNLSIKQTATINCHGENTAALEVNVQGGKTPFDYKWSQGTVTGAKATQLAGGKYELTLTDASGLSKTASIQIKEPEALTVTVDKNIPATNENSRDGKVSLNISGGTTPYSYNWDSRETTEAARKLPVGNHSVTVSDANACSTTLQMETKKKILPALTAGRLKQGQTLQVSNLYFEADSTNMTAASYPTLNEIASFLKDNPLVVIEVGGHTNNIPAPEFCDALSTARAKAVAEFIVKGGIDKTRVLYKGYGKREPKYSNNHKEGRAKNQRVEIKILSLQ